MIATDAYVLENSGLKRRPGSMPSEAVVDISGESSLGYQNELSRPDTS